METLAISSIEVVEVPSSKGLDPITVIFRDLSPGKGDMTILCYGSAWTSYWGAMGEHRTIKQFVKECDEDYLFRNLAYANTLKQGKGHQHWLKQIISVVKLALQEY